MLTLILPEPVFVRCDLPSRNNISLNPKLMKVPAYKIRNDTNRRKKERWDKTNEMKDIIRLQLISAKNRYCVPEVDPKVRIWISYAYIFKFQKNSNPACELRDLDNVDKGCLDALAQTGLVPNDRQIVTKLCSKLVHKELEGFAILSLATGDTQEDFAQWMNLAATKHFNFVSSFCLGEFPGFIK